MQQPKTAKDLGNCVEQGPQSPMESRLIQEYLRTKGYRLVDLQELPVEQARQLMREACQHASLRMAHMESTVSFRDKIRGPG